MQLSSDDLPMFFDDPHRALAARLRAVQVVLEDLEKAAASDGAIVDALAKVNLFELVAPAAGKVDARAI